MPNFTPEQLANFQKIAQLDQVLRATGSQNPITGMAAPMAQMAMRQSAQAEEEAARRALMTPSIQAPIPQPAQFQTPQGPMPGPIGPSQVGPSIQAPIPQPAPIPQGSGVAAGNGMVPQGMPAQAEQISPQSQTLAQTMRSAADRAEKTKKVRRMRSKKNSKLSPKLQKIRKKQLSERQKIAESIYGSLVQPTVRGAQGDMPVIGGVVRGDPQYRPFADLPQAMQQGIMQYSGAKVPPQAIDMSRLSPEAMAYLGWAEQPAFTNE
jgi:hypothetical protein